MCVTVTTIGEYQITSITTGKPWRENCYIVRHLPSGELAIIDPGDRAETIIQVVSDSGTTPKYILLTHTHFDHLGAAANVGQYFNLPTVFHKADTRLLHHAPMYAMRFAAKPIQLPVLTCAYEGTPEFKLGAQVIEVIHTPGHTPGSVCYGIGSFMFTGDTLLHQHIGRTDLPGGNLDHLIDSVNHLLAHQPGETILFPGHRQPWTIAEAGEWWQSARLAPPAYHRFES